MESIRGKRFHGEMIEAADASGGIVVNLYLAGTTSAYTLGANEHLYITDIIVKGVADIAIGVYVITNAAGKRVYSFTTSAEMLGASHRFNTPFQCPEGVTPYVIAAAGAVEVLMQGFITEG